jgi:hypothetical protein
MRKRIVLLVTALSLSVAILWAQDLPVGVAAAFKKGNSQELGRYLGEKIELVVPGQSGIIDKQSATAALSTFFANHRVTDFQINHQGKRDESSFVIGTLITASGVFRVNCFFRKIQNRYSINQIRINKTND